MKQITEDENEKKEKFFLFTVFQTTTTSVCVQCFRFNKQVAFVCSIYRSIVGGDQFPFWIFKKKHKKKISMVCQNDDKNFNSKCINVHVLYMLVVVGCCWLLFYLSGCGLHDFFVVVVVLFIE